MTDIPPKEPTPSPINLQLFRVTMLNPVQMELHPDGPLTDENRPAILDKIFRSHPSVASHGHTWGIGNYRMWGKMGAQFRLGRDMNYKITNKDERGDYIDNEVQAEGATDVVLDIQRAIVAIVPAPEVAASVVTFGRRLAEVLAAHPEITERGAAVEVSLLRDPTDFLDALRQADAILSLSIEIAPPNPTEVDKDFTEQLELITSFTGARRARITLREGHIDADKIEQPVRTASARGNTAKAKIRDDPDSEPRNIDNKTINVQVQTTREELAKDPTGIFDRIKAVFNRVVRKTNDPPAELPPGQPPRRFDGQPPKQPARRKKRRKS